MCLHRSAGSKAESFDPLTWRPEYPNPAFDNMRPDDAFWAARIVAKFSDADIRAIVSKARYTDPRATDYITATLIERRNKVLKTWLTGVNPLVDFAFERRRDAHVRQRGRRGGRGDSVH